MKAVLSSMSCTCEANKICQWQGAKRPFTYILCVAIEKNGEYGKVRTKPFPVLWGCR